MAHEYPFFVAPFAVAAEFGNGVGGGHFKILTAAARIIQKQWNISISNVAIPTSRSRRLTISLVIPTNSPITPPNPLTTSCLTMRTISRRYHRITEIVAVNAFIADFSSPQHRHPIPPPRRSPLAAALHGTQGGAVVGAGVYVGVGFSSLILF